MNDQLNQLDLLNEAINYTKNISLAVKLPMYLKNKQVFAQKTNIQNRNKRDINRLKMLIDLIREAHFDINFTSH
jgi:hypothetical protein